MAGGALVVNGDIQLGPDATPVLLRVPAQVGSRAGQWVFNNFNPFTEMELSISDNPRFGSDGSTAGRDINLKRRIEFEIVLADTTAALLRARMAALSAVFARPQAPGSFDELAFMIAGQKLVMYGRYRNLTWMNPELFSSGNARFKCRFEALDPWVYECTVQQSSTYSANVGVNATGVRNGSIISVASGVPNLPAIGTIDGSAATIAVGGQGPPRYEVTVEGTSVQSPVLYEVTSRQYLWYGRADEGAFTSGRWRSWTRQHLSGTGTYGQVNGTDLSRNLGWSSSWPLMRPSGTVKLCLFPRVEFGPANPAPVAGTATWFIRWQRAWMTVPT